MTSITNDAIQCAQITVIGANPGPNVPVPGNARSIFNHTTVITKDRLQLSVDGVAALFKTTFVTKSGLNVALPPKAGGKEGEVIHIVNGGGGPITITAASPQVFQYKGASAGQSLVQTGTPAFGQYVNLVVRSDLETWIVMDMHGTWSIV